ncbi:hypothetical protein LOAG_19118, partial [Loa loa]
GTNEEGSSAHEKKNTEFKFRRPNDKLVDSIFGQVGNRIASCLPTGDLKNMTEISEMSECANYELNRRYKVLHYRDGKITPPYLKKALELISKTNFTDTKHRESFATNHWIPGQAILFGREKPINAIASVHFPFLVSIFTSHKDHLEIIDKTS